MAWAVKQKTANSGQQLVLLLLANHTNGYTGRCNPSHKLLAEECRMGLSTLKNHIKGLEESGFLRIIHVSRDGVSLPNQYILDGVGQDLTEGRSEFDGRVGQNLATKQEDKPVIKPKATDVALPVWLPPEKWGAFIEMRKKQKKPMTDYAIKLMVDKLKKLRDAGHNIAELIDKSITNGWLDIYEPKGSLGVGIQLTAAEKLKRMAG